MFYYPYVITEMARMLIGIVVFFVVFVLGLSIIGNWLIFSKAGERPWASLIPFYNSFILHKITWGAGMDVSDSTYTGFSGWRQFRWYNLLSSACWISWYDILQAILIIWSWFRICHRSVFSPGPVPSDPWIIPKSLVWCTAGWNDI